MPDKELTGKTEREFSPGGGVLNRLREAAATIWKKAASLVHSLRLRIRPRVSLLTGSVLVLLTLYLPTVVGSCGAPQAGIKFASGTPNLSWPGHLLEPPQIGRAFYLFALALAVLTLLLLLVFRLREDLGRNRRLLTWLLAISSSVAFFSTTDLVLYAADSETFIAKSLGAVALLAVVCPFPAARWRVGIWTKKGLAGWALITAGVVSALWFGEFLFSRFYSQMVWKYEEPAFCAVAFLFNLLPLIIWFRYAVFAGTLRQPWPGAGRRLAMFYVATMAYDLLCALSASYWGLISFFVGMYLILFGYWQLRRVANESLQC